MGKTIPGLIVHLQFSAVGCVKTLLHHHYMCVWVTTPVTKLYKYCPLQWHRLSMYNYLHIVTLCLGEHTLACHWK